MNNQHLAALIETSPRNRKFAQTEIQSLDEFNTRRIGSINSKVDFRVGRISNLINIKYLGTSMDTSMLDEKNTDAEIQNPDEFEERRNISIDSKLKGFHGN